MGTIVINFIMYRINFMDSAYYLFKKGKKLSESGKFLEAIMLLEKARKFEPEKGSIREVLASAYYNCGLYVSAKKNFIKALGIDASNDFAHYGLGLCLTKENKKKAFLINGVALNGLTL